MMGAPPAPPQGPTEEEKRAAAQAKEEKIETTQDSMRRETDRLFRLYGARGALFGGTKASPLLTKM